MQRVQMDHWFINENQLSISLMNLYCKIGTFAHEGRVYCRLSVIDEEMNEMVFVMNNIEEAMYFVENYCKSLRDLDTVAKEYSRIFVQDREKGRTR